MLTKNQSEKRNSWKYYVLITVLAAFFLLFVTKVTAKEKQQFVTESDSNIETQK